MPISDLPLEVLSHIISLLAPPSYPSTTASFNPLLQIQIITLEPSPPPAQTPCNLISSVSKTSPQLLEAARPWLWENVDVRSGRGWLAVVNALTEEVVEELPIEETSPPGTSVPPKSPETPSPRPAPDAHVPPNTIPGGMARYISPPPTSTYPYPSVTNQGMGINITIPTYTYSPPQPPRPDLLLTPPTSRNASPVATFSPTSPSAAAATRLRGRSRSPRRNIGFDTKGISAILDRSRSTSVRAARSGSSDSWGRRATVGRRTSLSRTRTRQDMENEEEDDEEELDEEEDELMPLSSPPLHLSSSSSYLFTPPIHEEEKVPTNYELLPPPGPYIRHLSFVNFRTIGSRRTQDEAVRGRYVTAGRLEGVIKVRLTYPSPSTCQRSAERSEPPHTLHDGICRLLTILPSPGRTLLSRISSTPPTPYSFPLPNPVLIHRPESNLLTYNIQPARPASSGIRPVRNGDGDGYVVETEYVYCDGSAGLHGLRE